MSRNTKKPPSLLKTFESMTLDELTEAVDFWYQSMRKASAAAAGAKDLVKTQRWLWNTAEVWRAQRAAERVATKTDEQHEAEKSEDDRHDAYRD